MTNNLQTLRTELHATHHAGRIQRMVELGHRAKTDPAAMAMIDEMSRGDVFERRLFLHAQYALRDGGRLLLFTQDESRSIRSLAFTMVPLVCDDVQALEALKVAHAIRHERLLLNALVGAGRHGVVDLFLDWLCTRPGLHHFADIVPLATPEGILRHMHKALERPSHTFWDRMAGFAPVTLGTILAQRLREVPGEPDAVTRQLIEKYTRQLAEKAPEQALELLDLLVARKIHSQLTCLPRLGRLRPHATLALLEKHDLRPFGSPFEKSAHVFDADALGRIVHRSPVLLGTAHQLLKKLTENQLHAVVTAWCDVCREHPCWGLELIPRITDARKREQVWERWSVGARNKDGVIDAGLVKHLPPHLQEREARRHLKEVVALGTRPAERILYARFLPWEEADAQLKAYLGHPEGNMRGVALSVLLAIPGLRPDETELVDRALALVTARKNEQVSVRSVMLRALCAWPRKIWKQKHTSVIGQIIRDALDAGDLSGGTAQAAESLVVRTLRLDAEWGARWLATLIKERGNIHDARLGNHLTDDEIRVAAPHLLAIATAWSERERVFQLLQLAESLAKRVTLVQGLPELLQRVAESTPWAQVSYSVMDLLARFDVPRYLDLLPSMVRRWLDRGWRDLVLQLAARQETKGRRQPPLHPEIVAAVEKIARGNGSDGQIMQAVTLLRARAVKHFDSILSSLLKQDPSYVCIPVVHDYLHRRRQDLLDPYLGHTVIHGRFGTGKTAWLLPFDSGFTRWNPGQNVAFGKSLASVIHDPGRDTPTVWNCTAVMASLDSAPMDVLAGLAEDVRAAVQERAIRVMARCDRGQCVPTLLRCLEDQRARIAIYGLRRAVLKMPPARAITILNGVPLTKVTVAKEVVRLLGELRADAAYERLVQLDGTTLHRDVRIALLRALWDHLDREASWGVFERAVTGPDHIMASRVGDIPADRLTRTTDTRLSALLGKVLQRPEPEARIELLQRAALLFVQDPERTFLSACSTRLISPFDDEVQAAMRAIMQRSTEVDMEHLPRLIAVAMDDPRCLHVAINTLLSHDVKQRWVWVEAALAAEQVLAREPRWTALRVRSAHAAMSPTDWAEHLCKLGESNALTYDALEACVSLVGSLRFDQLEAFGDRLSRSSSDVVRRIAVTALVRDAGPKRGWSPERLERLAALQRDPSTLVSGAALAVFPPREMVADKMTTPS